MENDMYHQSGAGFFVHHSLILWCQNQMPINDMQQSGI
jgi:hypothetical protein